ncbi:PREDICTED: uncharacterized protein LOC108566842 [Nicrophorus vespilloides]|uniref:Uncharacterized protein LOC108566842 n=1 Tax=Nicrophorus vespilloides TaxID=110193 RepID=A0ABM1N6G0_NICVS|nr:PREDICTED: uncharacterized protein LOC108566842 [Nicrophorus vespilloides]
MGLKPSKINKHIHSKEDVDRPIVYYFNNIEDPMINERVRRKYRRIQASIDNLKVFGRAPYRSMKRWNSTGDLAFNRGNNSERYKKASKSMNNLVEDKGPSSEDQLNVLVQKLKEIRRRIKHYDGKESTAEIKMELDKCLSDLNTIDSNNKMVLELRSKMGEKINYYQESIKQKSQKYTTNQTKVEEIEAKIEELTGDIEYYYRTGEQEEYQTIKFSIDSCVKLLDSLDATDDVNMMKLKENYEKTLFDYDHEIDNINSKAVDKTIGNNRTNSVDTDDEFYDCFEEIPITPKSVKSEVERKDDFEYYSKKLDQVEQNFEKLISEKNTCIDEEEPPESPRRNKLTEARNKSAFVPKKNIEEEPPKLRPKFKEQQPKKIYAEALVNCDEIYQLKPEGNAQKTVYENVVKSKFEDDEECIYETIDEAKALLDEMNFKEECEYATVPAIDDSQIYAVSIKNKNTILNDGDEPPKLRPKFKDEQAKKTDEEVNADEIYQINENVATSKLGNDEGNIYETLDVAKALVDENNFQDEYEYATVPFIDDSQMYAVSIKNKKSEPLKPQISLNVEEEPPKLRPKFKDEQAKKTDEEMNADEIYQINEKVARSKLGNNEENMYETLDVPKALVDEKNFQDEYEYTTVPFIDDSQIYAVSIKNKKSEPLKEEPPKLRPRFKEEQPKKTDREALVNDDEIYQINENAVKTNLGNDEDYIYDYINEEKALIDEKNYKDECIYEPIPVINHEIQKTVMEVNSNTKKEMRPKLQVEQSDENYQYEDFAEANDENKEKHMGNIQNIEEQRSQEVEPKPRPRTVNEAIYGNIIKDNTHNNGKGNFVLEKEDSPEYIEVQEKAHEINKKIVKEYAFAYYSVKNDENGGKFTEVEEGIAKATVDNLESDRYSSQTEFVPEDFEKIELEENIEKKFQQKYGEADSSEKVVITKNDNEFCDVLLRKKTNVNENYENAEVVLTTNDDANIYENYDNDGKTDLDVNKTEKKRMKLADISESTAFSQTFSDEEAEDFTEDEPLESSDAISDENRRVSHIPKLLSVIYEESSFDEESIRTKEDSPEECIPSSESPSMSRRFSVNPMPDSTRIAFDSVLECVQNMKECVDDFEGTKTDGDYINIFENLMKSMSILNSFKVDDNETIEYKQRILHEIIQCMKDLECKVKPSFTY